MKPNKYRCANCGGIYETAWTEEEARDEAEGWEGVKVEDMSILCDDCYYSLGRALMDF